MVIKQIDGSVFIPQGEVNVDQLGVSIKTIKSHTIIPLPQIKWIYYGNNPEDDVKVYNASRQQEAPRKLFDIQKTSDELIKELY